MEATTMAKRGRPHEATPVFSVKIYKPTQEGYRFKINGKEYGPDLIGVVLATVENELRRGLIW